MVNESGEQVRIEDARPQNARSGEAHEKRRCAHLNTDGRRCGRWANRGEELCHPHLRFAESCARGRIDVPLLEDNQAVLYLLSQTAHALATGGMPPANGHAVISACKLATRILELRLKQKQWESNHGGEATDVDSVHPEEEKIACPEDNAADGPLMAVSDIDYEETVEPLGHRACDRVRARIEAAAAERVAQEGPQVQLPRFRKEDLQKQWERGLRQPLARNENNTWLSKEEKEALFEWRSRNRDQVRAREQRMLDEYFGRVKKEPAETAQG